MKGVTLLKPNKAMSELDYNDHREHRGQVGTGRKYRRMFWKAHRRECAKVVAEQLVEASDIDLTNIFVEGFQMDCEDMEVQEEIDRLKRHLSRLRRERLELQDAMYEIEFAMESVHDRIWQLEGNPNFLRR